MVKETLDWHARSAKNRLSPQPRRVFLNAFCEALRGCLGIMFQNRCHAMTLTH
jgi:hypothetical protein